MHVVVLLSCLFSYLPFVAMFSIIYIIPNVTCKFLHFLLNTIVTYLDFFFSRKFPEKEFYSPWKQSIIACKLRWRCSEHQHSDNLLAIQTAPFSVPQRKIWYLKNLPGKYVSISINLLYNTCIRDTVIQPWIIRHWSTKHCWDFYWLK